MVVDTNQFVPKSELKPGLLWVVEQLPGMVQVGSACGVLDEHSVAWPCRSLPKPLRACPALAMRPRPVPAGHSSLLPVCAPSPLHGRSRRLPVPPVTHQPCTTGTHAHAHARVPACAASSARPRSHPLPSASTRLSLSPTTHLSPSPRHHCPLPPPPPPPAGGGHDRGAGPGLLAQLQRGLLPADLRGCGLLQHGEPTRSHPPPPRRPHPTRPRAPPVSFPLSCRYECMYHGPCGVRALAHAHAHSPAPLVAGPPLLGNRVPRVPAAAAHTHQLARTFVFPSPFFFAYRPPPGCRARGQGRQEVRFLNQVAQVPGEAGRQVGAGGRGGGGRACTRLGPGTGLEGGGGYTICRWGRASPVRCVQRAMHAFAVRRPSPPRPRPRPRLPARLPSSPPPPPQISPRAAIFRRDQGAIMSLADLKRTMRYNDWKADPVRGTRVAGVCVGFLGGWESRLVGTQEGEQGAWGPAVPGAFAALVFVGGAGAGGRVLKCTRTCTCGAVLGAGSACLLAPPPLALPHWSCMCVHAQLLPSGDSAAADDDLWGACARKCLPRSPTCTPPDALAPSATPSPRPWASCRCLMATRLRRCAGAVTWTRAPQPFSRAATTQRWGWRGGWRWWAVHCMRVGRATTPPAFPDVVGCA